ncbi:MAG TPA: siderophore-interacting protein [Actinophytocola sp.]|uniref:siderophore-interacting protein n=1 Tax=Actinophytocola sp. TaxID=1872138 RepID=UPI002DC040BA|nr:siderophore-interacting protein [Actinophytocola sp.]HEU5472527.1 siderophore-interacting protein [Actinophytocola sp.]
MMVPRVVPVTGVQRITPRTVRITVSGVNVAPPTPDAHVKVFFPLPGQSAPHLAPPVAGDLVSWYRSYLDMPDELRPPMRTYTVRAYRPDRAEIDIDFVLHGDDGLASRWAGAARPGDLVAVLGPAGQAAAGDGPRWHLLVGDETAVPAIGSIIEAAPAGTRLRAFVEVADPEEHQRFASRAEVDIQWLYRNGHSVLLDAVRATEFTGEGAQAWVAGESGMVRAVRRHLVRERGFEAAMVSFHGYWQAGMSEEDVGRAGLRRIAAGQSPEEADDDAIEMAPESLRSG